MTREGNKPRSIAMITASFHPYVGGTEKQARELSRALVEKGHRVTVLTRRRPGLPAEESLSGIRVLRLCTAGSGAIDSLTFLASLTRHLALRGGDYDALHVHLASSPAVPALVLGRLRGQGVLVKLGGGRGIGEVAVSRKTWLGRLKLRALGLLRPRLVAVDKGLAEELRGYGLEGLDVTVVPNGVDAKVYAPVSPEAKAALRRALGLPEGPLILYAGRLSWEKRLGLFLEAFAAAPPAASFVMLGEGPEETALRSQVKGLGLEGRVRFLGARQDVAAFYQAADLFVLPSVSEGLPNAVLEAMSSGLVVLASKVGALPDIIEDGVNGFLFEAENPAPLAEKLKEVCAAQAKFPEIGRRARATILERFSLDKVADRYVELYAGERT